MDIRRIEVVNKAREMVGVKYRHQGRNIAHGFDCIGAVRFPYEQLGLILPTDDHYDYAEEYYAPEEILRLLLQYCNKVKRKPLPADILIIRAFDGLARHMALYTENDTVIHAINNGPRSVVENAYREPFVSKTTAVLSWKGFIDEETP